MGPCASAVMKLRSSLFHGNALLLSVQLKFGRTYCTSLSSYRSERGERENVGAEQGCRPLPL